MGTHPIFESDFDCLTDFKSAQWLQLKQLKVAKARKERRSSRPSPLIAPTQSKTASWSSLNSRNSSRPKSRSRERLETLANTSTLARLRPRSTFLLTSTSPRDI